MRTSPFLIENKGHTDVAKKRMRVKEIQHGRSTIEYQGPERRDCFGFPTLSVMQFNGSYPWGSAEELTLECPDRDNAVIIRLKRP